jgi:translation initiation factor RLI1
MNNTCIHLRVMGSYIYTCTGGDIQRTPLEKYNNKKTNTYLIDNLSPVLLVSQVLSVVGGSGWRKEVHQVGSQRFNPFVFGG